MSSGTPAEDLRWPAAFQAQTRAQGSCSGRERSSRLRSAAITEPAARSAAPTCPVTPVTKIRIRSARRGEGPGHRPETAPRRAPIRCRAYDDAGQVSRDIDTRRVAFCGTENISTPNLSYAAQYLACALSCERFTSALADSPCITRGQCGSLHLHRDGLPPSTSCRSPGAPVHTWPKADATRPAPASGFWVVRPGDAISKPVR
jgi:hypothetical protein